MAGPCSVESEAQIVGVARDVAQAGATVLRGGAFKPRSSPHSFQGLGVDGLKLLAGRAGGHRPAGGDRGAWTRTTWTRSAATPTCCRSGRATCRTSPCCATWARRRHPVLLKRGPGAKVADFLLAAEYILAGGNTQVMLCERGIITFEDSTRYTTRHQRRAGAQAQTHLPVLIDPSHATGDAELVPAVALAGVAAGADGLIIEVHPDPARALSDGKQSLKPERFATLMEQLARLAPVVDRDAGRASAGVDARRHEPGPAVTGVALVSSSAAWDRALLRLGRPVLGPVHRRRPAPSPPTTRPAGPRAPAPGGCASGAPTPAPAGWPCTRPRPGRRRSRPSVVMYMNIRRPRRKIHIPFTPERRMDSSTSGHTVWW